MHFEILLDVLIAKFSDIQMHFKRSSVTEKRKLIGSMYPENLCFEGNRHRTAYLSEPLRVILQSISELEGIKKGERLSFDNLSPMVARRGIEPLFEE